MKTAGKRWARRLVKVTADPDLCLQRVRQRQTGTHIPVSDDQVIGYNPIARSVEFDWDLVIDNNGPADLETVRKKILRL